VNESLNAKKQNTQPTGKPFCSLPIRSQFQAFQMGQTVFQVALHQGTVICCGESNQLTCWELSSGEKVREMAGHGGKVHAMSLSGNVLATGGEDKQVIVWDLSTWDVAKKLSGHMSDITSVYAVEASGSVFSGSRDNTVRDWDYRLGACRRIFKEHSASVMSLLMVSPNVLVSSSADTTVKYWDLNTGLCVQTKMPHVGTVVRMERSETMLATAGGKDDKLVKVWSTDRNRPRSIHVFSNHDKSVRAMGFVGERLLITGSVDGTVREWDLATGKETRVLMHNDPGVYCLVVQDDKLVLGSLDGSLKIIEYDELPTARV